MVYFDHITTVVIQISELVRNILIPLAMQMISYDNLVCKALVNSGFCCTITTC